MSSVRKFLDLSTSHLPENIMNGPLNSFDGVIAYEDEYGAWMWVPGGTGEIMGIDALTWSEVPPEIVTIWRHARTLDCDYVRFDADAPADPSLPTWEWR